MVRRQKIVYQGVSQLFEVLAYGFNIHFIYFSIIIFQSEPPAILSEKVLSTESYSKLHHFQIIQIILLYIMNLAIQLGSRLQAGGISATKHQPQPCLNSSLPSNPFVARPFTRIQPNNDLPRSVKMAVSLKIKDYENLGGFQLPQDKDEALSLLLSSPDFCRQVFANSGKATAENKSTNTTAYTGLLFQPVPWSPSTRKGMPQVSPNSKHFTILFLVNVKNHSLLLLFTETAINSPVSLILHVQDMEKYQESETHVIINVPPPLMFKANIYGSGLPTRLCAVFEIVNC